MAQNPNPNKYFHTFGKWKCGSEKGDGQAEETAWVHVRVMRLERSLWTRLGDSTLHKCPFKAQEEALRFTVTTSRLYSVNVKLHWGPWWTTLPWCYKKPSQAIHTSRTPTLFMFHSFMLIQEFLFKPYRRNIPIDKLKNPNLYLCLL